MAREAVAVVAVRTAIGKRNGALSQSHAADLSGHVLRVLAARTGIDPALVDDVIWGCVGQVGDQSANIGRYGVLGAGRPESVPGATINRACGSSQQALEFGLAGVISGAYDVVVAGGVEVMSRVPLGATRQTDLGLHDFDGASGAAGRDAGHNHRGERATEPHHRLVP
jgi:acetyl-CoA acyltransferase